jgi:K+-sensing histidine kinase KdpD
VISAADIDRLFQPFQRLAQNRSGQRYGAGLGLSIVKAIADAHDATITATPQPHGGLLIEVTFPPPDGRNGLHTGQHSARQSVPSQRDQPSSGIAARPRRRDAVA